MTLFLRGVYPNPLSWEHAPEPVLMLVLGGVHHFLGSVWGATTLHRAAGSAEHPHSQVVADFRTDPNGGRADLTRGTAGSAPEAART